MDLAWKRLLNSRFAAIIARPCGLCRKTSLFDPWLLSSGDNKETKHRQ